MNRYVAIRLVCILKLYALSQAILINYSFIRSFVHSFIRSFVHSFIRSFVHSFIRSSVRSFVRSFVHSFIRSFIHHWYCQFYYVYRNKIREFNDISAIEVIYR